MLKVKLNKVTIKADIFSSTVHLGSKLGQLDLPYQITKFKSKLKHISISDTISIKI